MTLHRLHSVTYMSMPYSLFSSSTVLASWFPPLTPGCLRWRVSLLIEVILARVSHGMRSYWVIR